MTDTSSSGDVPEGERCAAPHTRPTRRDHGLLCHRHWHHMLAVLRELEELWALRGYTVLPGPAGDARSGTNWAAPAPGRLDVMALTDRRAVATGDDSDILDVPGALAAWVRDIADDRGPAVLDGWDGSLTASVRVLRRERAWLARQDWITDLLEGLDGLHRAVARAVGASMWEPSMGACPACGAALRATIRTGRDGRRYGVDEVTCRRCRSAWTGVHIARLTLIHAQDQQQSR